MVAELLTRKLYFYAFHFQKYIIFFAVEVNALCPEIINRAIWGARGASSTSRLKYDPAPVVIVHHSDTPTCTTQEVCKIRIQNIQEYHMSVRGWDDIGYNFLVRNIKLGRDLIISKTNCSHNIDFVTANAYRCLLLLFDKHN